MNFQKQFDTLTGALNLFDLSYLVSGAAMIGVVALVFPSCLYLMNTMSKLYFVVAIIFATYITGMFSWIIGKRMRYFFTKIFEGVEIEEDFQHVFATTYAVLNFHTTEIRNMIDRDKNVAYAYMWQKLEANEKDVGKRRFLFISRFWTLRAIYEGLILPFTLLVIWSFWKSGIVERFWKACEYQDATVLKFFSYFLIGVYIWYIVVSCLSREARRCANTQIKEVIIAYYHFFEEK